MKITKKQGIGILALTAVLFGGLLQAPVTHAATPPESCFAFSSGVISEYYANEGNNGANPACPTAVDIPTTIAGQSVTEIGASAFSAKSITSVTIPNSVTDIGSGAFIANSLTSVIIPNSVTTIGGSAFMFNQLTSLTLGSSVVTIGNNAFSNGNQLTSLMIPDSTVTIGDNAFTSNQLTSLVLGDSVKTIGANAFASNQLVSLTMGNSVENINVYAFANNKLSSIVLPSSVITIDDSAFANNQLTAVTIPDSVTSLGAGVFAQNKITSAVLGAGLVSLPQDLFSYNRLTSVVIPASVTSIDPTAFYLQFADITELSGGDFSSAMDIQYVRVYTANSSNPNNLQDAQTLFPESAFGADVNGDGDQLDTISFGGHLINPAQVTVSYQNTDGDTIAPSVISAGDNLVTYLANDNDTNDLSRYFRLGIARSFTAPAITGYSIITPASPHNMTLAASDGNNLLNFVYSNPGDGNSSTNPNVSVPRAPDTGVASGYRELLMLAASFAGAIALLVVAVALYGRFRQGNFHN